MRQQLVGLTVQVVPACRDPRTWPLMLPWLGPVSLMGCSVFPSLSPACTDQAVNIYTRFLSAPTPPPVINGDGPIFWKEHKTTFKPSCMWALEQIT